MVKTSYQDLLPEAVDLAERAAKIAVGYFRKSLLIEMKENHTPVTIADKKTEEWLRGELDKRFPEHGIIGEEFGHGSRAGSELTWTVDPIDGTRSFIRGIPLWGTLLGLMHGDEPVLGVMVLPGLDETYSAAAGTGTMCNGHPVHVSPLQGLENAVVAVGDRGCFSSEGQSSVLAKIDEKAALVRGYTDCFGHSLVIRGAVDAMLDPLVSIWDIAPIACLVREAGGQYGNFAGKATVRDTTFATCGGGVADDVWALCGKKGKK